MRPCGHVSSASDLIDLSRLGPPVDRFGVFSMSLLISPNETISSIMYGCTPAAPPLLHRVRLYPRRPAFVPYLWGDTIASPPAWHCGDQVLHELVLLLAC